MDSTQQAEEIISEMQKEAQVIIPKLCEKWNFIGYSPTVQEEFKNSVYEHHKGLLLEMLMEMENRAANLQKNIKSMSQEIETLSKDLNTDVDVDFDSGQSLLETEKKLKTVFNELKSIKEARLVQFRKLLDKENEICTVMGATPVGLDRTIPSEEDLQNYEMYVSNREEEMIRLKNIFNQMRIEIIDAMGELGYTPKLDFERLIADDHQNFVFTIENMEKLSSLRDEMIEKLASAKETAEKKRQELLRLLEYLEKSRKDYEEFFERHSGCDSSTISALNKEIKRCKEIRLQNIATYVKKIREEIVDLWELCKLGQQERDEFRAFKYETFTEDILTLHELEVTKLKEYYSSNEPIFELFYQHQEMLQQMKDLELRAEDPNRLNNRGGQLLEEEKSRRLLNKNLPKLKAKLTELLDEYEVKNRKLFTFEGISFEDYLKNQMDLFNEEKENLRLARAKAKDEKRSAKKTPLSASRRNLAVATSLRIAQTSVKRKLPMDKSPVTVGSAKKRLVQSEKTRPTACGSKIRRSGKVSRKLLHNSVNRGCGRKSKGKSKVDSADNSDNSGLNIQQYKEFQEHLSERNELRSTLISEQVMKTVREENKKMKTPVKTPVKPLRKHLATVATPHMTPQSSGRRYPKSPQIASTPKLSTAKSNGLSKLKL